MMKTLTFCAAFTVLLCATISVGKVSDTAPHSSDQGMSAAQKRIIALSPHLTEIVFALGEGHNLVGVSDYSDYPQAAKSIPRLASYQGANIPAILRLKPSHVLYWEGGNKDADIAKMRASSLHLYASSVDSVDSLIADIENIAKFIEADQEIAQALIETLSDNLKRASEFKTPIDAIYVMNPLPLMVLGNDPWLNDLLSICSLQNVFFSSLSPYPQLGIERILRSKAKLIIYAQNKASNEAQSTLDSVNKSVSSELRARQIQIPDEFSEHKEHILAPFIQANPDKLHRFTPRAIEEMTKVCELAYTINYDVQS
ncbi:helical backbone metal receptor [Ningiella sp. W23]|uniref:helical backbone metal receptor n=1 Tax=Ningiella sp. W23 TaxID=3023715 RepID=UPI00375649ED